MATTTKKLIVHSGATDRGAILTAYLQFKEVTNDNTFQTTLSDFNFYISYKSTNGGHTIGPWSSGTNSILNFKGTEHKFNATFNATIPKTLGEGTHLLAKINIGPFVCNQANNGYFNYEIGVKWTANSSWGNVNNPSRTQSFSSYIEPAPKIISAPTTFTTGSPVTIKFTRPSSFKNTTIQACIAVKDGGTWRAEPECGGTGYQTINNSATSYTFSTELTKKIETLFPSEATEREVRIFLKWTGVSDKPYKSATAKLGTYSYQIPASAISISPIENIQQQLFIQQVFTGSANIYILNAENAKIKVTFDSSEITLPANGTIETYEILQGGKVVDSSPNNIIDNIILTTDKIGFRIKDKRGIYTSITEKTLKVIDYTPLKLEVTSGGYKDVSDSTTGQNQIDTKTLLLTLSGECFWGMFSSTKYAALNLKIDYIDAAGTSKSIQQNIVRDENGNSPYITNKDNKNYYNYTFTIEGLSPTTKNTISCRVGMIYTNASGTIPAKIATLEKVEANDITIQEEIPVFDYDDASFRFNVPVEFFGGDKLLWQCTVKPYGWFMNTSQKITLPNLFDMPNGMILVFSAFNSQKNEAENWGFQTFFIPKNIIEKTSQAGYGYSFMLSYPDFSKVGSKYLYFILTEDKKGVIIKGYEDNNSSETIAAASGIKYTNNAFVLRYIYGT